MEKAPPNTEWRTPSADTPTVSLSQAEFVRTAKRPAISFPSADALMSTADVPSISAASTATSGHRKSLESVSAR